MRTLLLDIETAPSLAYVWNYWKQNIGNDMVLDYGGYIMSCSLKWLDEENVIYLENRTEDDTLIVAEILTYLDEAAFVIAHNGKKFDIPYIKTRAVINGLDIPSPFKVIDTLVIAKKEMLFKRNTLEHLAEALDVPSRKLTDRKYNGFKLWLGCLNQEEDAWKEMKEYNKLDVIVLQDVYLRLRPWYSQHPNVTSGNDSETMCCPRCGSSDVIKGGYYYTNKGKYPRVKCKSCGGHCSGTYTENTREKRKSLLASR